MRKRVITLLSILFAASSAFAADCYPTPSTAYWSETDDWVNSIVPTASSIVTVFGGRTLYADTNAVITGLRIPNADSRVGTLIIEDDITLQATSWAYIGWRDYDYCTSTVEQSAGTFSAGTMYICGGVGSTSAYTLSGSGELTGNVLDIGYASHSNSVGNVTFNQSGGLLSSTTVRFSASRGSDGYYNMTGGQISVTDLTIGSGSTAYLSNFEIGTNVTSIAVADDLVVGPRGQVFFNLREDGSCTTIEVGDLFDVSSGSAKIFVDAALYTGGSTTVELITYGSTNLVFQRQAILNLPDGLTGSLVYNTDSLVLKIVSDLSEASISNVTAVSDSLISMTVTASDPEVSTIKTATDLNTDTWEDAPYSTNSTGPFATGALTDPEMTIYVQATNSASFFKVGNN